MSSAEALLQRLQMLEVGAGAEVLSGAGEQHRPHPFGAQIAAVERGQLGGQRRRQGVRPRRIVQCDVQQVTVHATAADFEETQSSSPGTSITISSIP